MGLQEAISGGRAHREEKATVFFIELKMPMLPPGFRRYLARNGIKRLAQIRLSVFQASTKASSTSGPYRRRSAVGELQDLLGYG